MDSFRKILLQPNQLLILNRSKLDLIVLNGVLVVSVMICNYLMLLLFVPVIYIKHQTLTRLCYLICTFSSNSLSTLILNFFLFLPNTRSNIIFSLLTIIKLYFFPPDTEIFYSFLILLLLALLLNKDIKYVKNLASIFEDSYTRQKEICDHLTTVFIFISEKGEVKKYNKAALSLFGDLKNKNLFDLIPEEKADAIQRMIKISMQKKIPEEDYTCNFPNYGNMYLMLSIKYVPLENSNNFLLCFDCFNINAKKRTAVFKSYQQNFALQEKLRNKMMEKYSKRGKISFKNCCLLSRYLYSQHETIAVTEMLVGQAVFNKASFEIKNEVLSCIEIYREFFDESSVGINFDCDTLPLVNSDRIKHHLLIKSILLFISGQIDSNCNLDIYVKAGKSLFKDVLGVLYSFKFNSKKVKIEDLDQVFLQSFGDIDDILAIQKKYDVAVSLIRWLLQNFDGKTKLVTVANDLAYIEFSLNFEYSGRFSKIPAYFVDELDRKDSKYHGKKKINRYSSDIIKTASRLKVSCGSDILSENACFEEYLE